MVAGTDCKLGTLWAFASLRLQPSFLHQALNRALSEGGEREGKGERARGRESERARERESERARERESRNPFADTRRVAETDYE